MFSRCKLRSSAKVSSSPPYKTHACRAFFSYKVGWRPNECAEIKRIRPCSGQRRNNGRKSAVFRKCFHPESIFDQVDLCVVKIRHHNLGDIEADTFIRNIRIFNICSRVPLQSTSFLRIHRFRRRKQTAGRARLDLNKTERFIFTQRNQIRLADFRGKVGRKHRIAALA